MGREFYPICKLRWNPKNCRDSTGFHVRLGGWHGIGPHFGGFDYGADPGICFPSKLTMLQVQSGIRISGFGSAISVFGLGDSNEKLSDLQDCLRRTP